jgi:hypothetical protein
MNRIATMAAVLSTAAVAVFGCSSSSSGTPFGGGGDDASMMTAMDSAAQSGDDAAEEPEPTAPCDASIVLPEAGAMGAECAACLEQKCMPALTTCSADCVCAMQLGCLVANMDNYTLCPAAMAAIGMGSPGLTAIGACLPGSCPMCNPPTN